MPPPLSLSLLLLLHLHRPSVAQTLYPFSDPRWVFLSNARLVGSYASLTESSRNTNGAVWLSTAASVADFTITFDFRITGSSNPSADGLCFVVQSLGLSAGGVGGGIGYSGITKVWNTA